MSGPSEPGAARAPWRGASGRRHGRSAASRERRVPGEVGTWVFILGDMTVFTVVFATYLYYRGQEPALFDASQQQLDRSIGAINTLALLSSSLCVALGLRAFRRPGGRAAGLFAGGFALGLVFVFNKYLEYGDKIDHGHTPGSNGFWTYYYVLTGLHLFHLLVGLCVLGYLIVQSRKATVTRTTYGYVEGGACLWHMVDLLWIVLFPLLYLVHGHA